MNHRKTYRITGNILLCLALLASISSWVLSRFSSAVQEAPNPSALHAEKISLYYICAFALALVAINIALRKKSK